ncbi:hypothetical protein [Curtobacterium sp. MCBD17_008]|uniref:hypothetical protein n=1 Tax=Curtobacterium sp. MCBD17_008 TaxID=2175656 RepID=UPI000DA9F630|nr:hypothetical protein [Curtobacterium sp. MCBD17_008]PZE92500.1 hypothetical protein DEI95_08225 [Curtobacterium sp. MCBD17_008]
MTGPDPSAGSAPLAALLARRRHLQAEAEAITAEIRRRGLARTANLVGELGERLTLEVLGGTLQPPGAKSIDLIDGAGRRVQVKTRELPAGQLRHFQFGDTELDFDVAVCVRFDRATFHVDWATAFDRAELQQLVTPHASGPRLPGARARDHGQDLTDEFRAAWARLQGGDVPGRRREVRR